MGNNVISLVFNKKPKLLSVFYPKYQLTLHPILSLLVRGHTKLSHTYQMRLTQLFFHFILDIACLSFVFEKSKVINSYIGATSRIIVSSVIGVFFAYLLLYAVQFSYNNVIFYFMNVQRSPFMFHLIVTIVGGGSIAYCINVMFH